VAVDTQAWSLVNDLLAPNPSAPLGAGLVAARAIVIYIAAVVIMRIGDRRFLGHNAAFDVIFGVIIGSVFARGINGTAPLGATLAGALVIVILHWLLAFIAFYSDTFGTLLKGAEKILIRDGRLQWSAMRGANITQRDLVAALHVDGRVADPQDVRLARLERSGEISVLTAAPRVVHEVHVEAGVHTVRIELI
jgi:uncharacterized membrane protein YcaP (DUF421 family)